MKNIMRIDWYSIVRTRILKKGLSDTCYILFLVILHLLDKMSTEILKDLKVR